MSIMQMLFGSKPVEQPTQQVQNQNQQAQQSPNVNNVNPQTQQTDKTAPNGVVPKQETSPLEQHKELWQPVKVEKDPNAPEELTPQKIAEAAGKVDFSKLLDQEMLKKVSAGGEEAVNAMASLMNQAASAAYRQSAVAAHKMVQAAVEDATNKFAERVPELIRTQSAKAALLESNAGFKNPAVQPLIMLVQEQLASKYPNATPQELNKMSTEFLQHTANIINPTSKNATENKSPAGKNSKVKADEDWMAWVSQDTQ